MTDPGGDLVIDKPIKIGSAATTIWLKKPKNKPKTMARNSFIDVNFIRSP